MVNESLFPTPFASVVGFLRGAFPLMLCFAVVVAISFLPPDSSFRDVDDRGRLRVCMPVEYPPLVIDSEEFPGFEVELMQEVADRSGWRFSVVPSAAMGRDFNPRSWRITRAQCEILAGGVALTSTTRSFMDTSPGHLLTGWVMVSREPQAEPAQGQDVGFYAGLSGLDRVQLAQYLRQRGSRAAIRPSANALREGLMGGEFDAAVTEALIAFSTFDIDEWSTSWLPEELGRFTLGLGFWRGDTTLRKHTETIMEQLKNEGFLDALAERYALEPGVLCHRAGIECR